MTGFNWKTVSNYVDKDNFNNPNPMPAQTRLCPKLDHYKQVIDRWLEKDKNALRKQRHTSKRFCRRLRKEVEGFNCSYRLLAQYVAEKKK